MQSLPLPDVEPPGSDRAALDRVRHRVRIVRRRRASSVALLIALVLVGTTVAVLQQRHIDSKLRVTGQPSSTSGGPTAKVVATSLPNTSSSETTVSPTTAGAVDLTAVDWDHVTYPIDCGNVAAKPLTVVPAEPSPGTRLSVVMVACDAGAGTPPRSVFVYDGAASPVAPHLSQVLTRDDATRITSTITATGATITATGGTYSGSAPRCCPDGSFTERWAWTGMKYGPA